MSGNVRIKCLLFLIGLIGASMTAIPFFLKPPGKLLITLKDEVFDADLSVRNARLIRTSTGSSKQLPIRNWEGSYRITAARVQSGPGEFEIRVEGYEAQTITVDIPPLETVQAEIFLPPLFGRLKIRAVNARDGKPVSAFQADLSGTEGQTSQNGEVVYDISPGTYTAQVNAYRYCPKFQKAEVKKGEIQETSVPISPVLADHELARIILDWGKNPRDLDAHLMLPRGSGLRSTHVYYGNKTSSLKKDKTLAAELDIDHQHSEGIETITIYRKVKGEYQYGIHLYAGDGSLGGSHATVEVVTAGCEGKTFRVMPECKQKFWHVFNLNYHDSGVEIGDINTCNEGGWSSKKK